MLYIAGTTSLILGLIMFVLKLVIKQRHDRFVSKNDLSFFGFIKQNILLILAIFFTVSGLLLFI